MKNINLFLSMLLVTSFSFIANAQPGTLDLSFNPGTGANQRVLTTAIQPDGKIIIGGEFTFYNGTAINRIARLNADGTLDNSFAPGTGVNFTVNTTAIQPDGKIIIGGEFSSYNGTVINKIARLNADGTLDNSFAPGTGADYSVYTTAIQSDGQLIIGGNFTSYNGTARNYIARLNADGTLDNSFAPGTGAYASVNTTAIQPDGKIIIGGYFTSYNGIARNRIARLNADGTLDNSFAPGTGANDYVRTTAIQNDGKIIIGGNFTSYNGTAINKIARLNADGTLDNSFAPGTGANSTVRTSAIQSDGQLIIGGDFSSYNGIARNRISRLNADGTLDNSFAPGTGANYSVYTTAIQSDGQLIIGGWFTSYNGTARNYIARINGGSGGVGINEDNIDQHYFSAYPNPSYGIFQLNFDNMPSSKGELEIYNVSGEKVYTASNIKQQMQIDLSALSNGIYFIKLTTDEKTITRKFVKQ